MTRYWIDDLTEELRPRMRLVELTAKLKLAERGYPIGDAKLALGNAANTRPCLDWRVILADCRRVVWARYELPYGTLLTDDLKDIDAVATALADSAERIAKAYAP